MYWSIIKNTLQAEPAFREKQLKKAIFVDFLDSWKNITVFPQQLRKRLSNIATLTIDAELFYSKKGDSIKALLTLHDGEKIETVLMKHNDGRNTVCVSSLVGCPMGCTFCATGTMGMIRKLSTDEIILQVLLFARILAQKKERVSGVVFMGMGEPLLNYDIVMESINFLHDRDTFDIGARHISISTCGILDGITRLAGEKLPLNLAISLHASNDTTRATIMPIARTYPIKSLLHTVKEYTAKTKRKVMYEYLLLDNINDHETHAHELAQLLRGTLCMVNLISYNSTGKYTSSNQQKIASFKKILSQSSIETVIRYRFGRDVEGACGQLVTSQRTGD